MKKHTIKEAIKKVGPLPFRLIGKWIIQICNSIKFEMKNKGKSAFVPLSSSLLTITDSMNVEYSSLVLSGSIVKSVDLVSPEYWSPEQSRGTDLSIQSSLYSLGVIAYEMITGSLPFSPNLSKSELLLAHMRGHVPKVSSKRPNVPPTLELIIAKLLTKDPTKRFDSPDEIAEIISRMTLNEDEAGVAALKMLPVIFGKEIVTPRAPTLSIQMRTPRQSPPSVSDPEAGRATLRMKTPVYQGPPEWESNLKVVSHSEKVVLTWTTATAGLYTCKVVKRGAGRLFPPMREDKPATSHSFELPGLEPDTGYSATIFNETDFVMRNFKTPVGLV